MGFISSIKRAMGIREVAHLKNTPSFMTEGNLFRIKEGRLEINRRDHWIANSCHLDEKYACRFVHSKLEKSMKKLSLKSAHFVDLFMLKDMLLRSSYIDLLYENNVNKYLASFDGEKVNLTKVE